MSSDRMNADPIDVPRGLTNVVVTETAIGDVRGLEGFYHYRQYSAVELAGRRSFEDVAHLLLVGWLPDQQESAAFRDRLAAARALPDGVAELLPGVARLVAQGDRLAGLRMAVAGVGAEDGMPALYDASEERRLADAIRLVAVTPVILAALHRLNNGRDPVAPDPGLGHVADYLRMIDGTPPDARRERAISAYLVAAIDHGFNASTFTTRVIASTGSDLASAVVGGLGALSGPLHGGAPSRALDTLDAIGSPDRVDAYVRQAIERGDRIMGFGHPVYRTEDPRSVLLRGVAAGFGGARYELARQVELAVLRSLEELKPGRALHTNLEYYAALVMELSGLPREMFTPTFAVGRMAGWTAHALEQARDPKIIRPSSRYVGPAAPQPF